MTEFLRNRSALLRIVDPTTSSGSGASSAGAQSTLASGSGGTSDDMSAMFEQGMQEQEQMYAQGMQESEEKDEMQTQGDAALKTLKAISIS